MENDNEIKEIVKKSKSDFLVDTLLPKLEKTKNFSMEAELKKTKSNKDKILYISVIGYVLLFIAVTISISLYINYQNRNTSIDIKDFKALDYSEVLDNAKKVIEEHELAIEKLEDIELDKESELNALHLLTDKQVEYVENNLRASTKEKEIKKILSNEAAEEEVIRAKYDSKIVEQKNEISRLERKVNDLGENLREALKKPENMGYEEIYQIRLDKVKERYRERLEILQKQHAQEIADITLKYNPYFSEQKNIDALNYEISQTERAGLSLVSPSLINSARGFSPEEQNGIQKEIRMFYNIMDRMLQVPYINSVAPALDKLDTLSRSIILDMSSKLKKQQTLINAFNYGLNSASRVEHENGYVLDPRDPDNTLVYIYETYRINDGDEAYVFRGDDEFQGMIRLMIDGDRNSAKIIQGEDKIKAFDKLLIKLK